MCETVRLIILWVSVGLNITAMILQLKARKRHMQVIKTFNELNYDLKKVLDEENKILLKIKEKQENEFHS